MVVNDNWNDRRFDLDQALMSTEVVEKKVTKVERVVILMQLDEIIDD